MNLLVISLVFPLLSNIVYVAIPELFFIPVKRQTDSLSSTERDEKNSRD